MARIMIVAGGCRGRQLARAMVADGHAVRVSTRTERGRAAIEATGAECWIGTPHRLASMRGVLDSVTIVCWLLASADGEPGALEDLHSERLEFFLTQLIDTTARGFLYEAKGGRTPQAVLDEGARITARITELNAIPAAYLTADPEDAEMWLREASAAVGALLSPP